MFAALLQQKDENDIHFENGTQSIVSPFNNESFIDAAAGIEMFWDDVKMDIAELSDLSDTQK